MNLKKLKTKLESLETKTNALPREMAELKRAAQGGNAQSLSDQFLQYKQKLKDLLSLSEEIFP